MHNHAWPNPNLIKILVTFSLFLSHTQKSVGLGSPELELLRGPVFWQLSLLLSVVRFGEESLAVYPVVDKETCTYFFAVEKGMCP